MRNIRTVAETRILAAEAEHRARAGESLTAIAHSMGVATSTLSDWARLGGWRRKDLEEEQAGEIARLTVERVAALRDSIPAPLEYQATDIAAEPAPDYGEAGKSSPELTAMAMAQVLLQRGQIEEADRAIRVASRFVLFQEQLERRVLRQ